MRTRTNTCPQQIKLLLKVLLQAAAPPRDMGVSPYLVDEYFRCWQRLVRIPPASPCDVASPAVPITPGSTVPAPVLELSLDVDHEAELGAAYSYSNMSVWPALLLCIILTVVSAIAVSLYWGSTYP